MHFQVDYFPKLYAKFDVDKMIRIDISAYHKVNMDGFLNVYKCLFVFFFIIIGIKAKV